MDLWFVCYCAPRQTLRLADALAELGAKVLCPRVVVRRRVPRKNRVEEFEQPMIGGVFFCHQESWPIRAGRVEGVDTAQLRRMTLGGKAVVVRDSELSPMRDLMKEMAAEDRAGKARPAISPGDKVVVKAGPLEGLVLTALRVTRDKVHSEINGVRVSIYAFLLERTRG
jgi:transcription antitermination factor NusG